MKNKSVMGALLAVAASAIQTSVMAGVIFVGSWQVDQGPSWREEPLAYTGQEAAALLFGGNAADYAISTIGNDVLNIDHLAWYSVIGVVGGHKFSENYSKKLASGQYYDGGSYGYDINTSPASAYVLDNATGSTYTNYAFRITEDGTDVPVPASLALLGTALLGLGALRRRAK